jgi:tetratricopeptide (TPR) repeat protein
MVMNSTPESSTASRLRRPVLQAGTIVLLTLVVYIPGMRGGFVWNDEEVGSLTRNIVLEENGLYRVWFTTESVNYWPVVWTSYWLEHQFWGLNPTGYHIVNVVLHALCALLIWRILIRLNIPAAWLAALVFAVHPVNVESVAWITQRKNILALLFFLVALLWYLRFDDRGRRGWFWGAVVAFLLAMLSKGAVVTLPVVLLLCVWWRRRAIGRRDVLRSLPFFAVAALMSGVEIWFQYARAIGEDVIRDDTILARLAGAGWVVWFYIYKALLPIRLCFVYPRWPVDSMHWVTYLPDLALLALFVVTWRYRRGWGRPVLFALAYFVITLAPVLGFVNIYFMRYSLVADHYQYVSLIAVIALVLSALRAGLQGVSGGHRWPSFALATAVVLLLGALTWQQSQAYEDAETLWRDTLRKNPGAWMAHSNLGNWLVTRGELNEAVDHYRAALRFKPDYAEVHNNLGNALALQGKADEAIEHYRQALQLRPDYAEAHNNLGYLQASQGRVEEAIAHYRRALQAAPNYAQARINLGNALARQRMTGAAVNQYKLALQCDPGNVQAHYNLGQLLARLGRPDDALPHLRQAARLHPDWPPPMKELAWILATHPDESVRRPGEAIELAERAAELTDRRDAEILDALAAAYASAGQFERAVTTAQEALALLRETPTGEPVGGLRARLELYRQETPYRATWPAPGGANPEP